MIEILFYLFAILYCWNTSFSPELPSWAVRIAAGMSGFFAFTFANKVANLLIEHGVI